MADEDEPWGFDLQGVSRISTDPGDDDDEDDGRVTYSVVFDAFGFDAAAEIEIYVTGRPDPAQLIILAMAHLHEALTAWARVTAGRRIANDDSSST